MKILCDNSVRAEQCRNDLNPLDSRWLAARQLSQRPQLVVLGNYVTGGREQRGLHRHGALNAPVAAGGRVEAPRCGHVLEGGAGRRRRRRAAVGRLALEGTDGVEAAPQQDAGDDQEQDAAGQPHAHGQLPARPVATFAALAQRAEHLALLPHRVGRLARHAQEVGGLGQEVGQVRAGPADGDALLVHEALALVAHEQAVPVGVVHDAVEGVQAAGGRRPAHPGRGGGDVVDHDPHEEARRS